MLKTRSKLLITLVLTTIALGAIAVRDSSATRLTVYEPIGNEPVLSNPATPNAGEPETPGNQTPPPSQNKYDAGAPRGEAPSNAFLIWVERIRGVWLALFRGTAF